MAVAVSRDLTVQVLEDINAAKLLDRQQTLRSAIQRGEPKCMGVTQIMLGIMVISYSIPLHFTEVTEVISMGVPWWSGLMFITAGVVAIILDKHCNMKLLGLCLTVSAVSTLLSVVAMIVYSVDIARNPEEPCTKTVYDSCNDQHYATRLSRGVKWSLSLFTLTQTVISTILCFLLFKQRRSFGQYFSLTQAASSHSTPPALN